MVALASLLAVVATGQQAKSQGKTASTTSAPTPAARIVPVGLWEKRSRRLHPAGIPAGQTFLELHVLGGAASEAKRYGRIVIREAVDDKGVSMTSERQPTQIGMWDDGFDDIYGGRPVEDGFSMEVWLKSGARDAVKIARVKGSFVMLVGGKAAEVVVTDLPSLVGSYVEDPALSAAGVKLKILAVPGTVIDGERAKAVAHVVEANEEMLLDRKLVDESGRKVPCSCRYGRAKNRPTVYSLKPTGKWSEEFGLKLEVLAGARPIQVPIDLKNLLLPGDSLAGRTVAAKPVATTATVLSPVADVEVLVADLEETRARKLSERKTWLPRAELKLALEVVGETASKATRYGRIALEEVVDSKGNNLVAEETNLALARDEFYTIWRGDDPKKGFRTYVLKLRPAARKAAKIVRLAGSLVLVCGGRLAETTVKDVLSLSGKEVADTALRAAGVNLRIGQIGVDVYGEPAEIRYVVTGNRTGFVGAEVVDENGKVVESHAGVQQKQTGQSSGSGPIGEAEQAQSGVRRIDARPLIRTLWVHGKMPAKPGLKVKLLLGAKGLKVPFDLRDIPLP